MKSKKLIKIKKIKLFLFTLIFLAVLSVGIFEVWYSDKYYPGVMITGKSVGGRTYHEVLQEFNEKSDTLQESGLNLVFEKATADDGILQNTAKNSKKEVHIPTATTGLTSDTLVEYFSIGDLQKDIAYAYDWGHKGSIAQRFQEQIALLLGKNFNLPISGHKEAIQSLLSRETKNFFISKAPAQFSFTKDNKVIIIPEKLGDNVDMEKIIDVILQKINTLQIQPVTFTVNLESPYTTEKKLTTFLDLAKKIANEINVNFYYQNHKWLVSGKTLVTWLTLKSDNGLTTDNKKLEAFLATSVVPLINDPPQNSRFKMQDGNLVEISPGKSGNIVNINKTVALIEGIIPRLQQSFITKETFTAALIPSDLKIIVNPKNNTIDVPIETVKVEPEVTQKTINQYHINDLIGYARTNFAGGSQDRQHNIEVGVSKLTGILIAPGREFSTVLAIGEITEEAGFVKEYVIKENQTVKELGGGLCQLATTLFRTTLNAGLSITERTNHKYVIPYYGPGLDATMYGPHPDFRFVNDTENYILLQGATKNNEVTFELYGTIDGRVAKVSEPVLSHEKPVPETRNIMTQNLLLGQTQCTTSTYKGITADVVYTVNYFDGSIKTQAFHSVYEAWPKVCLIGTALP